MDHPAVRLAEDLAARVGRGDELGPAGVRIRAAPGVPRARQRGELPAGDGQVDAEGASDLTAPHGAVDVDDRQGRDPLRAGLGQRVAAELAADLAEPVEL